MTTEEIESRLAEAETALHKLLTGQQTVSVSYNGQTISYSTADVTKLESYIARLKGQLGMSTGRKALSVSF